MRRKARKSRRRRICGERGFGPRELLTFELLEDRRLLSLTSELLDDYHVTPEWFAAGTADYGQAGPAWIGSATCAGPKTAEASSPVAGRWIVQLTPEAIAHTGAVSGVAALLNTGSVQFSVTRGLGLPGQILIEALASDGNAMASLAANPHLASFQRDRAIASSAVPDDSRFGDQWNLLNSGQAGGDGDIAAADAWDITTGSREIVLGVVDSGIDMSHPDLYQNMWINPGEIPASLRSSLVDVDGDGLMSFFDLDAPANSTFVFDHNLNRRIDAWDLLSDSRWTNAGDDDGNGFADDLFGWDFVNGDNDPTDDFRHGTHVAGTIAAMGNNGQGVAGVAWSASLIALKTLDETGAGNLSSAIAALNYATMMRSEFGVPLVATNNSWGYRGPLDPGLDAALQSQQDAGILVVAAAGNGDALGRGIDNDADSSNAFYPASAPNENILGVAASGPNDELVYFSNFGTSAVDLAAPGVGILSTEPGGLYTDRNGTSMAAPHVTGAAALVWSAWPEATVSEVRDAILLGVDPAAGLQSRVASGGRLNAYGALMVDTIAPRARLVGVNDISGPVATPVQITVEYTDNRAVVAAAINGSEIVITRQWDGQMMTGLTRQSLDAQDGGRRLVATYSLPAPGGAWGTADQGDYQIALRSQSVCDPQFNYVAAGTLGSFNVDTTVGLLRADVFVDGTTGNTLRAAVLAANAQPGPNTIRLRAGAYQLSISGTDEDAAATGDLDVTDNLVLFGAGADKTFLDAAMLDRFFEVNSGATVEVRDLSISGGWSNIGGAVLVSPGGMLSLKRVYIHDNSADEGGGVGNFGTLAIEASTLANNWATWGGGLSNRGDATLINTTISGNMASEGGGIHNGLEGLLFLTNVTIAENSAWAGGGVYNLGLAIPANVLVASNWALSEIDASGTFISDGHNLIGIPDGSAGWDLSDLTGIAPLLGPLGDNGGPTPTHALLAGSPAIDAGDNAAATATDQTGIARPQDADQQGTAVADIGAVERYYGEIHGVRYHDLDGDGTRAPGEPVLAGQKLYLDLDHDRVADADEPTAVTESDGSYTFTRVPPGVYAVVEQFATGWTASASTRPGLELLSYGRKWRPRGGWSNSISADGRYVAFQAFGMGLVPDDTSQTNDIFLWDRQQNAVRRISVAPDGSQADEYSAAPSISADGRYVAFMSGATNLVAGDTNGQIDVFVYDQQSESIERVSVAADGSQGNDASYSPSISGDGRYVVFESYASNLVPGGASGGSCIFVYDQQQGTLSQIGLAWDGAQPDGGSYYPVISLDGRFVAFLSAASDLVPDDTNQVVDVFVYDQWQATTQRVSVATDGTEANDGSGGYLGFSATPSISADGRFVAFQSVATNLVPGDTNQVDDVFVYDREQMTMERVSVASGGLEANGNSLAPSLSADGRYVAFQSEATDLVPDDTNGMTDVFLYDRQEGITQRVSVAEDGSQAAGAGGWGSEEPTISADGRYVAFDSDADNLVAGDSYFQDVYVWERPSGELICVSASNTAEFANGPSDESAISADGRYVALVSWATNLVSDDTNGSSDVFVYDRQQGTIQRVSVATDGSQSNSGIWGPVTITGDGRFVAFESWATNLVPGDTNQWGDVFVYDRQQVTIERVNVAEDGSQVQGNDGAGYMAPSLSADGRYVAFASSADSHVSDDTNGVWDIFVYDRQQGTIERVSVAEDGSQGNGPSVSPSISADGRFVAFQSEATNLVLNDTNAMRDVFVYDRQRRSVQRVSVTSDGMEGYGGDWGSEEPAISADGRYVAFQSDATNFADGDTNGRYDIFVYDRQQETLDCVSVAEDGLPGDSVTYGASISADGRYVTFQAGAALVSGDTNEMWDVYVYDRQQRNIERMSVGADGREGNDFSIRPEISADGRYVAFASQASNFDPLADNLNGDAYDIFVSGTSASRSPAPRVVFLPTGQEIRGVDFADTLHRGEIRGRLFNDLDGDQVQDGDEPGLTAWTVYLDSNGNGVLDPKERVTGTDNYGLYAFDDIESLRTYTVAIVPQNFWAQTAPSLIDGGEWTIDLAAGEARTGVDFGLQYRGPGGSDVKTIAGRFFRDDNGNGMQDADEPGLANRIVYVDANNNQTLDTDELQQTTGADGSYSFAGLPVGAYRLRSVSVDGWEQTGPLTNQLPGIEVGKGRLDRTQGIASGDFNGDGFADIAVANGNVVSILLGDGQGGLSDTPIDLPTGANQWQAWAVLVGNFNADGYLDLAVTNYISSTVSVLLGTGNATFAPAVVYHVGIYPNGLASGDFDHDGDLDLAVTLEFAGQIALLLNQGAGSFVVQSSRLTVGNSPFELLAAQLSDDNLDGEIDDFDWLDLAVANFGSSASPGSVTTIYNVGRSGPKTTISLPSGTNPASIAAADLDGDGDLDLAAGNFSSDNVSIFSNIGNGSFVRLPNALPAGKGPYAVTASDIDRDGRPDLLVANGDPGHLAVLRNMSQGGSIVMGQAESYGAGQFPDSISSSVAAVDLNRDSTPDIVVGNGAASSVSVMLNTVEAGTYNVTLSGVTAAGAVNFGSRSNSVPSDIVLQFVSLDGGANLTVRYEVVGGPVMPFEIGFYRSADTAFGGDTLSGSILINGAADRMVGNHTKTFTIGAGANEVALPGAGAVEVDTDYFLLGVVDPQNLLNETASPGGETNNTAVITGVYHAAGGPVMVHGSGVAELIKVLPQSDPQRVRVDVNGTFYDYAPGDVSGARIRGHAGNDELQFSVGAGFGAAGTLGFLFDGGTGTNPVKLWGSTGAAAKDVAALYVTRGTMNGPGYMMSMVNVRGITAYGNGEPDEVTFYDSSNDNVFTAYPTYATMSFVTYSNRAENFRRVYAYAALGSDTANLFDPEGNSKDWLIAKPTRTTLTDSVSGFGTTYYLRADNFEFVNGTSRGGADTAALSHEPVAPVTSQFLFTLNAKDRVGTVDWIGVRTACITANGFRTTVARSRTDTADDTVVLLDSAGTDTLTADLHLKQVTLTAPDFVVRAVNAKRVEAQSTSGADTAKFYDTEGDDLFTARPNYGELATPGDLNAKATGFRYVYAYGNRAGVDTAELYGIDGAKDYFVGADWYSTMADSETGLGTTYYVRVNQYDQVHGYGRTTNGRPSTIDKDQANLLDAATADLFEADAATALATYRYTAGSTFVAHTFRIVKAYGSASDTASLYGPGTYNATPNPVMFTSDHTVWAIGFAPPHWYPNGRPAASRSAAAAADAALSLLFDDDQSTPARKKTSPSAYDLALIGFAISVD